MATLTLYNCTNMTLTGIINYITRNDEQHNQILN